MDYTSMEMQDQFAHLLIGDSGTFLDLGSADPFIGNNTASLERIGWKGLAFEQFDHLANMMNAYRSTPCFCVDVTQKEPFISILNKFNSDKHFNYISLDVDSAGIACLKLLVDNGITFDAMTFEHDAYLEGDSRRGPSRDILHAAGYKMLFPNVTTCSKNWSSGGPVCRPYCKHIDTEEWVWEDWWIGPKLFENMKYSAPEMSHQECIQILRERNRYA